MCHQQYLKYRGGTSTAPVRRWQPYYTHPTQPWPDHRNDIWWNAITALHYLSIPFVRPSH